MRHPILESNQIHIWLVNLLKEKSNIKYLYSLLSSGEQKRTASFRFSADQEQFLITRGILRCILANYLKDKPQALNIMYNQWGKPCLLGTKALHFNLSHSNSYSIVAVTKEYEIGIDLERIDKKLGIEELASTIFSPIEWDRWNKICQQDKVNAFFRLWVAKEAFLKGLGKGWLETDESIRLEEFCFFENDPNKNFFQNKFGSLHYFQCLHGYECAFFIKGPALQPIFFNWSHDLIIWRD